jgi:hypothetical protein
LKSQPLNVKSGSCALKRKWAQSSKIEEEEEEDEGGKIKMRKDHPADGLSTTSAVKLFFF